MLETECQQVADASRRLAASGLVLGTAGNLSARAGELIAVTPTGALLEQLEADDIAVVDRGGRHVHGRFAATSELALHLGVYERYGAGGVVHTHAPMGTALSCVLDELPVIHYQMLELGGPVRVARYATFGTAELAKLTLDALEERGAALMSNHGTIACGHDLDSAVGRALLLEWACSLYWHAASIGTPRTLDDEQCAALITALVDRGYGTTQPAVWS
jgi:L-fuculose-phosphate aldolase